MKVIVYKDYLSLSEAIADEIITLLRQKPHAVISLPSGDSPKLLCELFVKKALSEKIDLSQFCFVGLDEWVGIPRATVGTCAYDFQNRVFGPLSIGKNQYHLFNGMAADLEKECKQMDAIISEKGGIDLMVVGIGMNGHIGFNEPGAGFDWKSHVIDLDDTTRTVGQKYFQTPVSITKGITLGLSHLSNTKKAILIANGKRKAEVIKKATEEKPDPSFPASIIQLHKNSVVAIDEDAASFLETTTLDS